MRRGRHAVRMAARRIAPPRLLEISVVRCESLAFSPNGRSKECDNLPPLTLNPHAANEGLRSQGKWPKNRPKTAIRRQNRPPFSHQREAPAQMPERTSAGDMRSAQLDATRAHRSSAG